MRVVPILVLAALGALAGSAPALAQVAAGLPTETTPSLHDRVEALDRKVQDLERRALVAEEMANARNATAGEGDGLTLRSASGKATLQFNGILQADARKFLNDDARALADTFVGRTIRPIFSGSYDTWLKWQFTPDFGGGTATIQDAWVDLKPHERVTIRVGKMTVPFGLERWQSTSALRFVERGYPTQLAPNRDFGVLVFGDVWGKRLGWAVGAFDGGIDNGLTDTDVNDSKELVGRLYVQPFAGLENAWLQSLLIGGAVTWGDQDGSNTAPQLDAWKTPGQNTFYSFRNGETQKDSAGKDVALPNPVARGARLRWTAHAWWAAGPVGLLAEYVAVTQPVARAAVTGDWKASAWQAALSYVIGGKPHFSGTQVERPFAIGKPGWGALELAVRANAISTEDASGTWADPAKSARAAQGFTGGLRWHASSILRVFLDYEQTSFTGGAAAGGNRVTEQAFLGRVQLAY